MQLPIILSRWENFSKIINVVISQSGFKVGEGGTRPQNCERSVGGQEPKMPGFLKFWRHVFASTSRQSAGIALKTSPIESYQFSASKLCTNFFSNSNQKICFFLIKNIFRKKTAKIIFRWKSRKNLKFRFSDKIFRISNLFRDFHRKIFLADFFSKNIFDPEKKYFLVGVGKKVGT